MLQITGARVPCRVAGPLRRLEQAGRSSSLSRRRLCLWRTSAQVQTGASSGRDPVPGLPTSACRIQERSLVLIPPCKAGLGPASGSPDDTGSPVSHSVHTFVQGLDPAGRRRLARCLDLDPAIVEQLADSGRTPLAWQSDLLREDVLLGRLFAADDVHTFELGCRFLTGMSEPPAKIWKQIADPGSEISPLTDAICRLCASEQSIESRVQAELKTIRVWMYQNMQRRRWRGLSAIMLDRLAGLGVAARASLPTPDAAAHKTLQQQAAQARDLIPWLLEQEVVTLDAGLHSASDYLVRQALDALLDLGNQDSRVGGLLYGWYQDWLALKPLCEKIAAPELLSTKASGFDDWVPSSYGGSLPRLKKKLAGKSRLKPSALSPEPSTPRASSGPQKKAADKGQPGTTGRWAQWRQASTLWLAQLLHNLGLMTSAESEELFEPGRKVLMLGGLLWDGDPGQPSPLVRATEAIVSRAADPALRDAAVQRLQWAFCHCLYNTIAEHKAELISQVPYVSVKDKRAVVSGTTTVGSVQQLVHQLLQQPDNWQAIPLRIMQEKPLQTAVGDPGTLVLDSQALVQLAEQFLARIDKEAFWQESATREP